MSRYFAILIIWSAIVFGYGANIRLIRSLGLTDENGNTLAPMDHPDAWIIFSTTGGFFSMCLLAIWQTFRLTRSQSYESDN